MSRDAQSQRVIRQALGLEAKGAYPPPDPLIDAAARDVPIVLRNIETDGLLEHLTQDSEQKISFANDLIVELRYRGHIETAARWAVYRLVEREFLNADFHGFIHEQLHSCRVPGLMGEFDTISSGVVRPVLTATDNQNPTNQPVQTNPSSVKLMTYLVVRSTDDLWAWWRHALEAAPNLSKLRKQSAPKKGNTRRKRAKREVTTDIDMKIYLSHARGLGQQEIANQMGISRQRVGVIIKNVKTLLDKKGRSPKAGRLPEDRRGQVIVPVNDPPDIDEE